jgi:glycosyltransferase involved in cell wall biosynthesis
MNPRPLLDVLHVIPSLDPGQGGPSRTVPALAAAQAAHGARVALATVGPLPPGLSALHPGVEFLPHRLDPGPAGRLLRASSALAASLPSISTRVIHAHGLWQRPLHHAALTARLHRVPLVVAPRGMLEPWALAHHPWRKRLAASLVHPGAWRTLASWHATSDQEAANLRKLPSWIAGATSTPPPPCCVAPNGIAAPPAGSAAPAREAWIAAYPNLRHTRVALFYGRFHRKKRVGELIELWCRTPRPGWTLLVAGLPGDLSVERLRASAKGPGTVLVADGARLPPPYALAELFLLPSHSENFGQAVAEALAAGLPALVTDTLPWRELDAAAAGRCVPWPEYPAALSSLLAKPPPDLATLGARARRWVLGRFSWSETAHRLLEHYQALHP